MARRPARPRRSAGARLKRGGSEALSVRAHLPASLPLPLPFTTHHPHISPLPDHHAASWARATLSAPPETASASRSRPGCSPAAARDRAKAAARRGAVAAPAGRRMMGSREGVERGKIKKLCLVKRKNRRLNHTQFTEGRSVAPTLTHTLSLQSCCPMILSMKAENAANEAHPTHAARGPAGAASAPPAAHPAYTAFQASCLARPFSMTHSEPANRAPMAAKPLA